MMAKQKQATIHHIGATNSLLEKESNWYKTSKAGRVFCPLTQAGVECVGSDYWDHPAKEDPSHRDT